MVDTTFATLDFTQSRNVRVEGNSFNNVTPADHEPGAGGPYPEHGGRDLERRARAGSCRSAGASGWCESVVPEGLITNACERGALCVPLCGCREPGPGGNEAQLRWGEAVRGKVLVSMRMDVPA